MDNHILDLILVLMGVIAGRGPGADSLGALSPADIASTTLPACERTP